MTFERSSQAKRRYRTPGLLVRCALLSVAASAASCGLPQAVLDPYGRPYKAENAMTPQTLARCRPSDVDEPPRLLSGTRPLYPIEELMRGRRGSALLSFEVSESGAPVVIDAQSPNPWFGRHAAIAMRDWKVEPARRGGVAVPVVCQLEFNYVLYGPQPPAASQPASAV